MNRADRLNDTRISHTELDALLKSNVALETHGLSLKSLQAFLTLASEHSFTKAAKELNLTQSGLSRIIGSLENEVGEQLFYRSSQLVRLTVAGEGLVPHAKHLVHCYVQALSLAGAPSHNSASMACASMLVADLLPHLPQAETGEAGQDFRVHAMGSHMVLDAVRSGTADLGVCIIGELPDDLCVEVLYQAPLGLLARHDVGLPPTVNNLKELTPFVFARLSDEMVLPKHLRQMGVDLPSYFSANVVSDSMTALMSSIRSKSCVSLVSQVAARHTLASDLTFIPLPNSLPSMHLCIVCRRSTDMCITLQQQTAHLSGDVADAQKVLVTSARKAMLQIVGELRNNLTPSSTLATISKL